MKEVAIIKFDTLSRTYQCQQGQDSLKKSFEVECEGLL